MWEGEGVKQGDEVRDTLSNVCLAQPILVTVRKSKKGGWLIHTLLSVILEQDHVEVESVIILNYR